MGVRKVIYKTSEELESAGLAWARRLGLHEWELCFTLDPYLQCQGVDGSINYELQRAEADIRVCTYVEGQERQDQEETLVHELLHLYFLHNEPQGEGETYKMWEQSIQRLARAIVRMWRKDKPVLEDLA